MGALIGLLVAVAGGIIVWMVTKKQDEKKGAQGLGGLATGKLSMAESKNRFIAVSINKGFPTVSPYFTDMSYGVLLNTCVIQSFGSLIEKYSNRYDLPPLVVASVIYVESGGKPTIQSANKASTGLMQLERGAVKDYEEKVGGSYDVNDLKVAEINVKIGCWYLRYCIDEAKTKKISESIDNYNLKEDGNLTKYHIDNSELYHGLRCYNGGIGKILGTVNYGDTSEKRSNWRDGAQVSVDYANKVYRVAWSYILATDKGMV